MRQIKFRAFFEGKMMEASIIFLSTDGKILYGNSSEIEGNLGEVPFMQFTGLKDKNGIEIYEGDIVKFKDHPTGVEDGIGKVYWKDGMFRVEWSMIPLGEFGTAWVEVLGNIYENPELVKQIVNS